MSSLTTAPLTEMGAAGGDGSVSVFSFSQISYAIPPKSGGMLRKPTPPKTILEGASARVPQGSVLAIVGPSGAGKTTLLNTITFVRGGGQPTGILTLNGVAMTKADFVQNCIYVPREDTLWASMTPRQHLDIAYQLYKPKLTASERTSAVDELLSVTGMASCQHTKAGGLLFQGLSGGQRRRLSLALALVRSPRVIILDEPTSGLDSAAAAAIVSLLKAIATSRHASVLCTIHQPSAAVFASFDDVLVLTEGRVAYRGPTGAMSEYFEKSLGKTLPSGANPVEAVLDLVSKDMTNTSEVQHVIDTWAASGKTDVDVTLDAASVAVPTPSPSRAGAMLKIFRRQLWIGLTDPIQYWARIVVTPFLIAFFGLVYVESADEIQTQVPYRIFFLWWVLAIPPCLAIIQIVPMNFELRTVKLEMRSGMYSALDYSVSTTLVQAPMLILLSFAVYIFAFAIGGWPWDNFLSFALQSALSLFAYEAFAQLVAVAFASPILGMMPFMMFWASSILFCGLVFKGEDVIWPLRLFYYMLPLKWLFNSTGWDIFTPTMYSGALSCTEGDLVVTQQGVSVCAATSFYCPNATSAVSCFGHTGSQVLRTLHLTYESLNDGDDRGLNTLVLLAIALVFKLAFTVALWRAAESSDTPARPSGTRTAGGQAVPVHVTKASASA